MEVGETLTVNDEVTYQGAVLVAATSHLKANWTTSTNGDVSFDEAPTVTGTMEVGQTLTVNDEVTYEATALVAETSSVTAVGAVQGAAIERTVAVAATSSVAVSASITRDRSVAITATSTLGVTADRLLDRTASVTSSTSVAVDGSRSLSRAVSIAATSSITATANVTGVLVASQSRVRANWATTTNGNVSFSAAPDITGTMEVGETLTVNDEVVYDLSVAISATGTSNAFSILVALVRYPEEAKDSRLGGCLDDDGQLTGHFEDDGRLTGYIDSSTLKGEPDYG